jgi:dihydrofolate reductase
MSKVVASFFMSLDGVVESPQSWHFPYMDAEMGAVVGQSIAASGGFLLGRRTYEEWADFWPHQDPAENPMAAAINGLPKYVVSRTLEDPSWENTTVLRGGDGLAAEVGRLKEQPGRNLSVAGSATLVRSLIIEGLLDELDLLVHPVLVGTGGRLFEADGPPIGLELGSARTFGNGVQHLTYRPAAA